MEIIDYLRIMSPAESQSLGLKEFTAELNKTVVEALGMPPEMLMPGKSDTVAQMSIKDIQVTRALYEAFDLLPPPDLSPGYLRRKAKEHARKRRSAERRRKR